MKRLRDERGAADPLVAAAARLVSAREPLAEDAARRQRVRARMRRRRSAPGAAWLRVAAAVLLVFSVAAASAMIGRAAQTIRARMQESRAAKQREHERTHAHRATPPTAATEPTPPTAATAPIEPAAATEPTAATAPVATPPAPSHAPARVVRIAASAPRPAQRATPPVAPSRPVVAAAADRESDEARLVADAVRALRHEHDPARAAALLQRYLDRYPDGVAAEDALALALEATIGRDPPHAVGFATRYLARYPSGRWSALARRALEP
jgi:cytoskeletal protein RodZ